MIGWLPIRVLSHGAKRKKLSQVCVYNKDLRAQQGRSVGAPWDLDMKSFFYVSICYLGETLLYRVLYKWLREKREILCVMNFIWRSQVWWVVFVWCFINELILCLTFMDYMLMIGSFPMDWDWRWFVDDLISYYFFILVFTLTKVDNYFGDMVLEK